MDVMSLKLHRGQIYNKRSYYQDISIALITAPVYVALTLACFKFVFLRVALCKPVGDAREASGEEAGGGTGRVPFSPSNAGVKNAQPVPPPTPHPREPPSVPLLEGCNSLVHGGGYLSH